MAPNKSSSTKYSNYASEAVLKKRMIEEYLKSFKEKTAKSSLCKNSGSNTNKNENDTNVCLQFVPTSLSIDNNNDIYSWDEIGASSSCFRVTLMEDKYDDNNRGSDEYNQDQEREKLAAVINCNGNGSRRIWYLLSNNVIVGISCLCLIATVVLFSVNGAAKLYMTMDDIRNQWDNIQTKSLNSLFFAHYDNDDDYHKKNEHNYENNHLDHVNKSLLDVLMNEVDRKTHSIHGMLDNYCPKVRTNICITNADANEANNTGSTKDVSLFEQRCNLDDIPLRVEWEDWLSVAYNQTFPHTSLSSISTQDHGNYGRYNLFSKWIVQAQEDIVEFLSFLDDKVSRSSTVGRWMTSITLISNIGLVFIALGILTNIILYPMIPKKIPPTRTSCVHLRMAFWLLVLCCWSFGTFFSIATILNVDVCSSQSSERNAIFLQLVENWEDQEQYHDDDDNNVNGITQFWKYQLQQCHDGDLRFQNPPLLSTPSPFFLSNPIHDLFQMLEPTHKLAESLKDLLHSEIMEDVCGIGDTMESIQMVGHVHALNHQLCQDTQLLTPLYLELTSCEYSPWYSLYDEMIQESICTQGMSALSWTVGTQIMVLILTLIIWTFRYRFPPCQT